MSGGAGHVMRGLELGNREVVIASESMKEYRCRRYLFR